SAHPRAVDPARARVGHLTLGKTARMAAAIPSAGGGLTKARRTSASDSLRDLRRAQIVAAAREIVAGDGLESLTIGALEKRLGFSRGVITYHFRDKDEIVE